MNEWIHSKEGFNDMDVIFLLPCPVRTPNKMGAVTTTGMATTVS